MDENAKNITVGLKQQWAKLAYVVNVRRDDGTEYLAIHEAKIDYDKQEFTFGQNEAQIVELK